jgi:hypothetical protein
MALSQRLPKHAAQTTERVTDVRHRAGAIPLCLSAQQSRRTAELALSSNRLAQLENYATLFLALGGDATRMVRTE